MMKYDILYGKIGVYPMGGLGPKGSSCPHVQQSRQWGFTPSRQVVISLPKKTPIFHLFILFSSFSSALRGSTQFGVFGSPVGH